MVVRLRIVFAVACTAALFGCFSDLEGPAPSELGLKVADPVGAGGGGGSTSTTSTTTSSTSATSTTSSSSGGGAGGGLNVGGAGGMLNAGGNGGTGGV